MNFNASKKSLLLKFMIQVAVQKSVCIYVCVCVWVGRFCSLHLPIRSRGSLEASFGICRCTSHNQSHMSFQWSIGSDWQMGNWFELRLWLFHVLCFLGLGIPFRRLVVCYFVWPLRVLYRVARKHKGRGEAHGTKYEIPKGGVALCYCARPMGTELHSPLVLCLKRDLVCYWAELWSVQKQVVVVGCSIGFHSTLLQMRFV